MSSREQRVTERLLGPAPSLTARRWAWFGPLIATLIGGLLRFYQLGRPHQLVFDETYYVKEGYSLWLHGYEREVKSGLETPDVWFTEGTPDVFGTTANFVVHPPVGKWLIGLGEWVGGVDSGIGWRLASFVCGTLMILMLGRVAWKLFRNASLATVAALVLAFDNHHFVHSRTGLLDIFVGFFALLAFYLLLKDREWSRTRWARRIGEHGLESVQTRLGPWMLWRPWRLAAAVALGLCCGTKWSGAYFVVVFGLLTVWWDLGARRTVGVHRWMTGTVLRDAIPAAIQFCGLAVATYIATWTGWLLSTDASMRQWGAENPASNYNDVERGFFGSILHQIDLVTPDVWRSLAHYHVRVLDFHEGLTDDHAYMANPWSWIVQGRPTSFFYESPTHGQEGCAVEECSKAIQSLGNPAVWWVAAAGIPVLVFCWLLRRDWRAGAILAGYAGGWLPWFFLQHRTIFSFYAVAFVPFVVLTGLYLCSMAMGGPDASQRRRRWGGAVTVLWVAVVVALFAFFWPISSAQVIPHEEWQWRMWFPSWI